MPWTVIGGIHVIIPVNSLNLRKCRVVRPLYIMHRDRRKRMYVNVWRHKNRSCSWGLSESQAVIIFCTVTASINVYPFSSALHCFLLRRNKYCSVVQCRTERFIYLFIEIYLYRVDIISSHAIFHNYVPCSDFVIWKQTQHICITFIQRWSNVFNFGPTLCKCYTNVLCLLRLYNI